MNFIIMDFSAFTTPEFSPPMRVHNDKLKLPKNCSEINKIDSRTKSYYFWIYKALQ
jgi:hypothetical protein